MKTYLIATESGASHNLVLKDRNSTITEGQYLTLCGVEVMTVNGLVNEQGAPLTRVFFGLMECCNDCRKGKFHLSLTRLQYNEAFVKVEETIFSGKGGDAKEPEEMIKEPDKQLLLTEGAKKMYPAGSVISKLIQILNLWPPTTTYPTKRNESLYFGRYKYELLQIQEGTENARYRLWIEIKDRYSSSRTRCFVETEHIDDEMVLPLVSYYDTIKKDLDKIHSLQEEIHVLYETIKARESVRV